MSQSTTVGQKIWLLWFQEALGHCRHCWYCMGRIFSLTDAAVKRRHRRRARRIRVSFGLGILLCFAHCCVIGALFTSIRAYFRLLYNRLLHFLRMSWTVVDLLMSNRLLIGDWRLFFDHGLLTSLR